MMKNIVTVGMLACAILAATPAFAEDAPSFTVQGKPGMQFRAVLVPVECIKKKGKKFTEIPCTVSAVEAIVLTIGPPLKLTESEHTFDLVKGIKEYTKAVGAKEYPIKGYGGVCVAYIKEFGKPTLDKCGPLNGKVQFN